MNRNNQNRPNQNSSAGNNTNGQQKVQQMMQKLSKEDAQKVQSILHNKVALEQLLSTPQAKELMKKFGGK
ncbi:hypothetical protein [Caproicibacterium sp. BJN0003]|uniref:hypothetical protein n=1 Tax=Caproicibacterium sp. BJN0003 TaxID=2994078 RepID=UPI00224CECA9|nr:hypothetical protein [Caproicibacterium sp. BJN0003]UZT82286.1 hypothetical protein OP489_00320 [Caproicibacterium sp. BJN0003]